MSLLVIKDCSIRFGGLKALTRIRFNLEAGEILAIIGPNGAGKTTLFNLLTGVYSPNEGEIFFNDSRLQGLKIHKITRLGMARTFQNIRLFPDLTVWDNVLMGGQALKDFSVTQACFKSQSYREFEYEIYKKTEFLLKRFGLEEVKNEAAKNLPYGSQRRLEIARALATNPKLLLLDEPAAGMNASEKKELMQLIREVKEEFSLSIILIEHDMDVVMNLCPRIIVLDYGEIIAEGTPEEIRKHPKVIEAYLGVEA